MTLSKVLLLLGRPTIFGLESGELNLSFDGAVRFTVPLSLKELAGQQSL